jgi:hypothetical protein
MDTTMKNLKYSDGSATYVESLEKKIAELENQLGFIASINRAGLGVVTATPMPSKKVEKIWNAIEEQKDDNFHYGWKKCEQYYGFSTHPAKELTDEEIYEVWHDLYERWEEEDTLKFARAILRKAQEK